MTSRKRKQSSTASSDVSPRNAGRRSHRDRKDVATRKMRRKHLLEKLEARQLLAGPQLIGVQPNDGDLIVDGSVRETAPRLLTFRFDEDQQIDPDTFSGIQISRAGDDGDFNTADDVPITPGLVTLGDPNENEVVVRFAESLPDDEYRIEVFGFDDAGLGVTGLRNEAGELFVPDEAGVRAQTINFELRLGALVESVVPQPVVRLADGSLAQNRNEVVVYFNDDQLFVEDDASGNPTARSAENPRFYQLLLTRETVRTTDDVLFNPDEVVYDAATNTARLFFSDDINNLPGVPQEGGTFRLRVGTAVDDRVDLILPPLQRVVAPAASFEVDGGEVTIESVAIGEDASGREVRFVNTGAGGLRARVESDGTVVYDLGGSAATIDDLDDVTSSTPSVASVVRLQYDSSVARERVPRRLIGAEPLVLSAVGDTLATAMDVGVFRGDDALTSLVFRETISPQPFAVELPGGNDDPGHRDLPETTGNGLIQHINERFGADTTAGITEIAYNFSGMYDNDGAGTSFLNQITERQKTRIREALDLWAARIGVQFHETESDGVTFALGNTADLQVVGGTQLYGIPQLNARLRVDPTFEDAAIVFSNRISFGTAYGEDFLRKAAAGIGLLLGLEQTPDLPAQTLMTLSPTFLENSIDVLGDLEPVFPGNHDVLHGRYLYRPDSIDVDLYRFEVDLDDADKRGNLTAETFAERLADSSLLDTTLTLFQQINASVATDFGVGPELSVRIESVAEGRLGNNARLEIIQSDRSAGDDEVRIIRKLDSAGNPIDNALIIDIPRRGPNIASVPVGEVIEAINNDPLASQMFRATLVTGDAGTDVSGSNLSYSPLVLRGGAITQLTRNDDYFSEDSRITASLGAGVYYIGIAASGNDSYDPTLADSGFGGLTQGDYELNVKFEPQVDEVDVIRDLDSPRPNVPGTPLDGDGDGIPGGVHNFWFQARPLNRRIEFTNDGAAVAAGQTITVVGASSVTRTYEFVPVGGSASPGNVPVFYSVGTTGPASPPASLASALQSAINSRRNETGVTARQPANASGTTLELVGERSIDLSDNFRAAETLGRTIFVDKTAGPQADGSLDNPFNNISNPAVANAFGAAESGDIVRIVGNGGQDQDITTEADNFSYKVGLSQIGGETLEDGRNLEVPEGVTTMIDAGAAFKLRGARISVGSSTVQVDRSNGALQVLGTPRLVNLSVQGEPVVTTLLGQQDSRLPGYDDGSVIFTAIGDRQVDAAAAGNSAAPTAGAWGGLVFRRDIDQAQGRSDLEDEGIFLQRVNHAEIRYGGSSNILIDSVQQTVNPIQLINLRPTITFNEITQSADSAISAAPDSFEETSFQSPRFQQAGAFTADYARVGPEIRNNLLVDNSINGLFIRVTTTPNTTPKALTVAGRFDDIDVVHYLAENITIAGTPGGAIEDGIVPGLASTALEGLVGGSLDAGTYDYRLTFVDANGFESLASDPSAGVTVGEDSSIQLVNLPPVAASSDYSYRRLYRLDPVSGEYFLVAQLDATNPRFLDDGSTSQGVLDLTREGVRGRLDASLVVDPGMVVKIRGARIELGHGTQLLAEGTNSHPVIFSSSLDDRFGAGGTFDTNNDNNTVSGAALPQRGDWAGIYGGPNSTVSLDHATVAFGGGVSLVQGGQSRGFAPLELQQADGRVTNSTFEFNDDGQDGAAPLGRFGRLGVTASTIFVRGAQPIIVGNQFIDNRGSLIDIDSDSMTADRVIDLGRQTGEVDRFAELDNNFGPLVRLNRYDSVPSDDPAEQQISGMEIRGGVLTTESVWDDTDIVHTVFDSIISGNVHSSGGLRLVSRSGESLVVKFDGAGSPFSATSGTGLTATGTPLDITDRIGGSVQIVGLPGAPVVMTSIKDDSVGAGLTPAGEEFTDTNGDAYGSRPAANDWRSVLLDEFSNDRNVDYVLEQTITSEPAPGLNGSVSNAQVLGQLATSPVASDDQLRAGFEVEGFLNAPTDVDTYSFQAEAGTQVWIDVDSTTFSLDSVLELLDADGNVVARSDDSFAEVAGDRDVQVLDDSLEDRVDSLQASAPEFSEFGAGGLYEDFASVNPRDAGMRVALPGNPGTRGVYFLRVRSGSVNPDDAAGGLTQGGYRFQLRLQEDQEFGGSTFRFADIRYANHGVHLRGLPGSSPLLGDAQENEGQEAFGDNASNDSIFTNPDVPGQRAQYIGNLLRSKNKTFSVGGALGSADDVDNYQIDVFSTVSGNVDTTAIFDIDYADGFSRPNTSIAVFYDPDGEDNPQPPRLVLIGEDSNVLEDQAAALSGEQIDLLSRGSVSTGDPFIGPITLGEGSYFVSVFGDGVQPDALNSPTTRREPIESLIRIFEDHVEEIGGSTAADPRQGAFVDEVNMDTGWGRTTDRATDVGHQRTSTFNQSRVSAAYPTSVQFESESNNFFSLADNLDDDPLWSLADDPNVGDYFGNTSQQIPHTKVLAGTAGDVVDLYQFVVDQDGSQVILDVDNGFNPNSLTDQNSVDLKLQLFREDFDPSTGTSYTLVQSDFTSSARYGALGSSGTRFGFDFVSSFSEDPYIQTILSSGTYVVAVSPEATTYDAGANPQFALDPADRPQGGTYELNVSMENHAASGGDPTNQSYRFNRSQPSGTLTANEFDLSGYSSADMPRLYFNYFYDPAQGDTVQVTARSNEHPTAVPLGVELIAATGTNEPWRQAVVSLESFAGDTGIVIEYEYTTAPGSSDAEGLYLDDFLVGFAERGELITSAASGLVTFTGATSTALGEYQLEMRPATTYGATTPFGLALTESFDTNERHTEAVTLVAPYASQITDGDTFTLSDGARSVTFEFDSSATRSVASSHIRVPFTETATRAEIADAIRTAINLPTVQSTIDIQASDSSGSANGGTGDVRVTLTGFVRGDLYAVEDRSDIPPADQPLDPSGDEFRLPAIFEIGKGDSNVQRAQGQIIIDSTKISDMHAIGVWSETTQRDIDPQDLLISNNVAFLEAPPIGNVRPGAVRNLPTLNDEVIGGLAPGVVVRSSTIDQAGYAGIKLDGAARPFVIDSTQIVEPIPGEELEFDFGDFINDGLTFTIDAAGTRVVFEFDDISGDAVEEGGSGEVGGDGFADGHVPVYYRRTGSEYNVLRDTASTRHEVMLSIFESIQGSILVTNGLVQLVDATLAPSLSVTGSNFGFFPGFPSFLGQPSFPTPAVFLEGVSEIYFSTAFNKLGGGNPFAASQIPVYEAPQPFSRIVNNTIYGEDGTESLATVPGDEEPNDVLAQAVDTKQGNAHTGPYITEATIGDTTSLVPAAGDVDLYEVELGVGDRLVVDVDTLAADLEAEIPAGPDTVLRVFDSSGRVLAINAAGVAPDHLETSTDPGSFDSAITRAVDPFIDYTALEKGTYYVGVSSEGNDSYDARSISNRTAGTGGTGDYTMGVEVFAPRSFVLSVDNGDLSTDGTNTGIQVENLYGTTFTITQIPDRLETLTGTPTNQLTFEFSNGVGGLRLLPSGNVNIPLQANDEFRVPDVMQAIADAISGALYLDDPDLTNPPLPNHAFNNGPGGADGPIEPVTARALGGRDGIDAGLLVYPGTQDYQFGFGHDRTREVGSIGFAGTSTLGSGTTELYTLVERAADIEISPEAAAAGLHLDPVDGRNIDQLLPEVGVMLTGGSSATILNNVFSNLHQSVVREETRISGFGTSGTDLHPKPSTVVVTANVFQYDESANNEFRENVTQPFSSSGSVGLSTNGRVGPSNVNGGNDDFNITLGNFDPLFVNANGDNFLPDPNSVVIDSSVNSATERDAFANLKASVGLPSSNILAPDRDVNGVLRADNPFVAPPGGIGGQVFKDRGSTELADFIGPVAVAEVPDDNDPEGVDVDPAESFIQLGSGVYDEFRIQLRDTGSSSDPFAGSGIDDSTVVVPEIPGVRPSGANVTLFENNRLLAEGIDYTFNYDETKNLITLTPLAGVWRSDRSYRVSLNNRDRDVLVAPAPSEASDGDQIRITDSGGGTIVFEFESGYQLLVPEALTLVVPRVGTNAGGLSDADVFTIDDGQNSPVVFEFNRDDATLPGSVSVALPTTDTPIGEEDLAEFLNQIANNIADAVQSQIDAGNLNGSVRVIGDRVVIGTEAGTTISTDNSGLSQAARTLALRVPNAGVGASGVQDGDTFVVNNGNRTVSFEFDTGNGVSSAGFVPVDVAASASAADVALAISTAVDGASLGLTTTIEDSFVYLDLPAGGSATALGGQLSVVGLSRTPVDGETITLTPASDDGTAASPVVFEINRTDEIDSSGNVIDDGVADANTPINISVTTTGDELADLIAHAVRSRSIAGLDADGVASSPGGIVSIGGMEGLGLEVASASMEVSGAPSVAGSSTIQVFGPLLVQMPFGGGAGLRDGSVLILRDEAGNDVVFEFNQNTTAPTVTDAVVVSYNSGDTTDMVADNLIAAINAADLGITATKLANNQISLGRIERSRVSTQGIPSQGVPGATQFIIRRGIVRDEEALTIRQGDQVVRFEFEAINGGGGVTPGSVPVTFQAGSTIGDIAVSLAAAINNNLGGLRLAEPAEAEMVPQLDASGNPVLDANGDPIMVPSGQVRLNDIPGTVVDVTAAPTLNLVGVPGGAIPIRIAPGFSPTEVKQAMLLAINSVNDPNQPPVTTLTAQDRGGATFFVENGQLFEGPLRNFFLPAIKDLVGNPLEPNRDDLTTQFTILLPTVGLDYGDAPDPVAGVLGRYPTLAVDNGARHVVGDDLSLGSRIDADSDGLATPDADGDDQTISISGTGTLFNVSVGDGAARIDVLADSVDPSTRDGDTITITTTVSTVTLEFDLDGRFDEDNFAISPDDSASAESIALAIEQALADSPLQPSGVVVSGGTVSVFTDDEDGVSFTSETNPAGVLNQGVTTPISVTVDGAGILEAWIDFNADGDWDDPGEQIIDATTEGAIFGDAGSGVTRVFNIEVPSTTPVPRSPQQTFARFRVSREGGLDPTGLALSGEVEDYSLLILPGLPPQIGDAQQNRTYSVQEDVVLQALDGNGTLTATANDNGILEGIVDPDGDDVAVFEGDVGTRTLTTPSGSPAGELTLLSDGTFTFNPVQNFSGDVSFTARVTDLQPADPDSQLVNSRPVSVTISVLPVNDPPVAISTPVDVEITVNEDAVTTLTAQQLIDPFYAPGPENEGEQPLLFQSATSSNGLFTTELGGSISIAEDGRSLIYTPPANFTGPGQDSFSYVVSDDPGVGQLSESASVQGTVRVNFLAVNDPPIVVNNRFDTPEGTPLVIPIDGPDGILSDDSAGPTDELNPPQNQTISLASGQFPLTTVAGGSVVMENGNLRYTPPALFSGTDRFSYTVVDSEGAMASGLVIIGVDNENNAPAFVGVNGTINEESITFNESKNSRTELQYNLSTWFQDADNDPLTFTVASSDPSVVDATVQGNTLTLTVDPYVFGQSVLSVTATDLSGASTTAEVPVTVQNTPDAPTKNGSIGPIVVDEDATITRDLSTVFSDRDGDTLTYTVSRLDGILNPTLQQIADHPLVRSIDAEGGQMTIRLEDNAFGSAVIDVTASDGMFQVTDSFDLTVEPVPDDPTAVGDGYTVPIGASLQILNPGNGLLRNDSDADGDAIQVDLDTVTQPSSGTLSVNADGTFTYTNTGGEVGETDSFQYRTRDAGGALSSAVTVTLTINQSRYQNPIASLTRDVNADGFVTAIDALRIINLLNRVGSNQPSVPVSEIGTPPPDYVDVNGDGRVSAGDALLVINALNRDSFGAGEGEWSTSTGSSAALAASTTFASASSSNLPVRNVEAVSSTETTVNEELASRDALLTVGLDISSAATESAADWIAFETADDATQAESVDEALALLANDLDLP